MNEVYYFGVRNINKAIHIHGNNLWDIRIKASIMLLFTIKGNENYYCLIEIIKISID